MFLWSESAILQAQFYCVRLTSNAPNWTCDSDSPVHFVNSQTLQSVHWIVSMQITLRMKLNTSYCHPQIITSCVDWSASVVWCSD